MIRKERAQAEFERCSEGRKEGLGDATPDQGLRPSESMSKTIAEDSIAEAFGQSAERSLRSRLESLGFEPWPQKRRYCESRLRRRPRRHIKSISISISGTSPAEPRLGRRQTALPSPIQEGDQADARALSRALSRFLCRAALFLWMRFFPDALSSRGNARLEASCAPLTSLLSSARIMRLMLVRILERKLVLCMRLFSDCRARFLAWELLATGSTLLRIMNSMRQYRSSEDICKYPKKGHLQSQLGIMHQPRLPWQRNSIPRMSISLRSFDVLRYPPR